jgi:hypothetical protein
MLAPTNATASATSGEYRRRARQLRARHAHDLGALHKALSDLARESDHAPLPAVKAEGPATGFAQRVAQELDGPVLRYSKRQMLLREADRRGIGRFEANLIIAAVQHQSDRPVASSQNDSSEPGYRHAALAACAVQGLIFLAMYLLLFN